MKQFCVYIMTNHKHGTLYIGVTSNLIGRGWQHKEKIIPGFTKRYKLDTLVYYEIHEDAESAIKREKRLKSWLREWKVELIEKHNPQWRDLYDELFGSCGQAAG
jgi:putative endonuclease